LLEGKSNHWDTNGDLQVQINFKGNKKEGMEVIYNSFGFKELKLISFAIVRSEVEFKNNLREGKEIVYQ
jgi:antitoxin component YwqK of YwqJK toxin-antitoxin module